MPRPLKHRKTKCNPSAYYFKPRGIPLSELEEVILEIDELESLRLADSLAYSHELAASKMKISRATFGRIVERARKKVVDAILSGKAIKISSAVREEIKLAKCKRCGSEEKVEQINKTSFCFKCKGKKES